MAVYRITLTTCNGFFTNIFLKGICKEIYVDFLIKFPPGPTGTRVGVGAYFQKCSFDSEALEVRALLPGGPVEHCGVCVCRGGGGE